MKYRAMLDWLLTFSPEELEEDALVGVDCGFVGVRSVGRIADVTESIDVGNTSHYIETAV